MLLAVSLILSTFVRFGPLSRGLETNGGTDANGGYSEERSRTDGAYVGREGSYE